MPSSASAPSGGSITAPSRLRLILAVCCFGQFMVVLDASVVNVALTAIQSDLHFSASGLQWVINAYTIAFAGFLLLGGRLADLFGRRRVFLVGITVFTLASLVGGLAFSPTALLLARAVQGLGAAIMAPATLTVLGTTFTAASARAKAFGTWGAVAAGGGAIGVLAGGAITEFLSWRWILLINVPLGIGLYLVTRAVVTESCNNDGADRTIDVAGAVSVTLGIMALVFGLASGEQDGWGSAQAVLGLGAGVVLLAFFFYDQARLAKQPLVPLSIFRNRSVSAANVVSFTSSASLFSTFYFFTLFAQQVLGYTPLQTGLSYLPLSLAIFAVSRGLAPHVSRIGGPRAVLSGGLVLSAIGLLWLSVATADSTFVADLLGPTLLLGIGQGMVSSAVTMAGTAGLPWQQAGLGSGLLNANRQLGGAIGLAVLVAVAASRTESLLAPGATPTPGALTAGYGLAFLAAVVFPVVGVVASLFAPGGRTRAERAAANDKAKEKTAVR